jgi:hypothetical protein
VTDLEGDFSRRPRGYLDRLKRHLSLNRMHRLPEGVFLGNPFADIDPPQKADEIYFFLFKRPVYNEMKNTFGELGRILDYSAFR